RRRAPPTFWPRSVSTSRESVLRSCPKGPCEWRLLTISRHFQDDLGAAAGPGLEHEFSAERVDALADADQAKPPGGRRAIVQPTHINAAAIVCHDHSYPLGLPIDAQNDLFGAGMLRNVVQQLLHRTKEIGHHGCRQDHGLTELSDFNFDAGLFAELVSVPFKRRH